MGMVSETSGCGVMAFVGFRSGWCDALENRTRLPWREGAVHRRQALSSAGNHVFKVQEPTVTGVEPWVEVTAEARNA